MDRKQLISRLLAKARKYRSFARWIGDGETSRRIWAMAEERGRLEREFYEAEQLVKETGIDA